MSVGWTTSIFRDLSQPKWFCNLNSAPQTLFSEYKCIKLLISLFNTFQFLCACDKQDHLEENWKKKDNFSSVVTYRQGNASISPQPQKLFFHSFSALAIHVSLELFWGSLNSNITVANGIRIWVIKWNTNRFSSIIQGFFCLQFKCLRSTLHQRYFCLAQDHWLFS